MMTFGKHKGTPVREVPVDYLRWFVQQDWSEKYLSCKEKAVLFLYEIGELKLKAKKVKAKRCLEGWVRPDSKIWDDYDSSWDIDRPY